MQTIRVTPHVLLYVGAPVGGARENLLCSASGYPIFSPSVDRYVFYSAEHVNICTEKSYSVAYASAESYRLKRRITTARLPCCKLLCYVLSVTTLCLLRQSRFA